MTIHESTQSERAMSPAVASAIAGGLLVGLSTAIIAFVFIGPRAEYGFSMLECLLLGMMGSVFGIVAGAVAGASETGTPTPAATEEEVTEGHRPAPMAAIPRSA